LSFTGSTEVGRDLLRKAAENVVSCSMELGGNAPVIVCADADLAVAVEGTMVAKMRNGGEACTAANRIYVHTDVAEEFTRRLSSAMAALPMGPGMDRSNRLGPLINPTARRKVTDLVGDAVRRGAALATDTRPDAASGNFYPPTVLAGVDPDADIMHTEVFGPVAPIATFSTDEEAIALANSTELGLASYVFGELGHALRLAEHIEAGMVAINRGLLSDPAAPFGGVKQSGLGREGAHDGLLEFTETKYIAVDW
jgi:succinate-semialdehyde dehydrogenase/glutarate-semialdehyde dehydrogenase